MMAMTQEMVGVVIFSVLMAGLVGVLVANVLVAIYRERKARRKAEGGPTED
jgi:hypothetical protein